MTVNTPPDIDVRPKTSQAPPMSLGNAQKSRADSISRWHKLCQVSIAGTCCVSLMSRKMRRDPLPSICLCVDALPGPVGCVLQAGHRARFPGSPPGRTLCTVCHTSGAPRPSSFQKVKHFYRVMLAKGCPDAQLQPSAPRSASRLPPSSPRLCWPPYDPRPALEPSSAPKRHATCVLWPNTALPRSATRSMADRGT